MTVCKADLVLTGKAIFTGMGEQPVSGAVAIAGNRILPKGHFNCPVTGK